MIYKQEEYKIFLKGDRRSIYVSKTGKVISVTNAGTTKELKVSKVNDCYQRVAYGFIHRIVALTFIPNFENKKEVNHKDGNRDNNNVDNLEWCTPKENSQHAHDTGLNKTRRGVKNSKESIANLKKGRRNAKFKKKCARCNSDFIAMSGSAKYCNECKKINYFCKASLQSK